MNHRLSRLVVLALVLIPQIAQAYGDISPF